jgi:hypothetical protein
MRDGDVGFFYVKPLFILNFQLGLSGREVVELNVSPVYPFSYGLEESFFGSKPGGQMLVLVFFLQAVVDLARGEDLFQETGIFFSYSFYTLHFDDVDSSSKYHIRLSVLYCPTSKDAKQGEKLHIYT